MGNQRKVIFQNKESKQYIKAYSNQTYVQATRDREAVIIDFYDETTKPVLIASQMLRNDEMLIEFDDTENEIVVERERTCTLIIPKEQAIRMATIILNSFQEEVEEE